MKIRYLLLCTGLWVAACVFSQVQTGAERMSELTRLLEGKRVALVVNQTSVVGDRQVHLLDTLLASGVRIVRIFAPEHGFRGEADAGETVQHGKDLRTGLPIISIYGKTKKPEASQLQDIDVVVFDIQDVGSRFYTYISTMHYVMEACAEQNKQLIVCDRPNPNDHIDGPVLDLKYRSFVGMHPLPVLHGLTVGELARMINGEKWLCDTSGKSLSCNLTVVEMKGWKHGQPYHLPVKPSPNLPNDLSIALYPSLCFFEATRVSIGRGTTFPFQVAGAPDKKYGTFVFKPVSLEGWDKSPLNQDKTCYGIDLRRSDFSGGFTLRYFLDFYRISGEKSSFFSRPSWFDLLAGNNLLRKQIIEGMDEAAIRLSWAKELDEYKKIRMKYILY